MSVGSYGFEEALAANNLSPQNEDLRNDQLYLGLQRPRVRGEEYDRFVDKFVQSARRLYPQAYIHLYVHVTYVYCLGKLTIVFSEDFGLANARRILDKYRPDIPCFNDDVQGTGCVTLAAMMAGLHVSKLKLTDMRLVIFGSGTAGTGIADQVKDAIAAESDKSKEDAAKQIW